MHFTYPAIVRRKDNLTYEGRFPDLEGAVFEGETLDDALEEARHVMHTWIDVELEEEDGELPPVSDAHDLPLREGEFVRNVALNYRLFDGYDE